MDRNTHDIVRRVFRADVKATNSEKFTVEAIVSDETIDRYGEVILASAWANGLKAYKKHPVLLSSHNYHNLTAQIGKTEKLWVEDDKLMAKFSYFVGEGNEQADWGFKLAEKGLAAFSVGFISKEYTTDADEIKELISGKVKPNAVFKEVELLEVSQVLVPANPSALAKSIDYIEDPVVKTLFEESKLMVNSVEEKNELGVIVCKQIAELKEMIADIQLKLADLQTAIELKNEDDNENKELASVLQELRNFETVLAKNSV